MSKGSERMKAWRLANPEKAKAYYLKTRDRAIAAATQWVKDNPERAAATATKWRSKNKDKISAASLERYKANRESCDARTKAFYLSKPWYKSWQSAKSRCENTNHAAYHYYGGKGVEFKLSQEDCKTLWERDAAATQDKPSLDRIDPRGDYVFSNCRYIEHAENCRQGGMNSALSKRRANGDPGAHHSKHT